MWTDRNNVDLRHQDSLQSEAVSPALPASPQGDRGTLALQQRSLPARRASLVAAQEGAFAERASGATRRRLSGETDLGTGSNSSASYQRAPWRLLKFLAHLPQRILHNNIFACTMTALTIYVLVGDDVRLVWFEAEADRFFNWVTIMCLCLFTAEIVLSSIVKEDYFLGFWFLCDIFASASLIFDLTFVSEAMLAPSAISVENFSKNQNGLNGGEESEYARASRASRVGTRVARLLRVVRLVRLSRIMRCLHGWLLQLDSSTYESEKGTQPGGSTELEEKQEAQEESRVGRKLSERTTQRVILLVLAMLFVVPQIHPGEAEQMTPSSAQYGANVIFQAWKDYELAAMASNATGEGRLQQLRMDWEKNILMYVYYHNFYATCPSGRDREDCAATWLYKLCWIGYVRNEATNLVPDSLDILSQGFVQLMANSSADWDEIFSSGGRPTQYVVGSLPGDIKAALARPWTTSCSERDSSSKSTILGVSLISGLPCPRSKFRLQETFWFTPEPDLHVLDFFQQHMEGQFVFVFDQRDRIEWEAILGIVQTGFVVIVLAIGALMFSRDADQLVLLPIERMIIKVDIIRQDPLYAIRLGDLQFKEQDMPKRRRRGSRLWQMLDEQGPQTVAKLRGANARMRRNPQSVNLLKLKRATLETKILENAIIKLGSLLALGFGEAGSEIIGQNLDDDNATVDALVPGSKVEAIYGFCNIRNFTIVTEVLQEKTMVFVNQVAGIVHRIVDEHLGAANKNVGEAFLLVWRIGLFEQDLQSKVADLAVMSFIQVVAELSRDRQLAKYREHPALLARLPHFRVSLGFGLHLGWSIEGAIGSEFKIDASYLSPHVNIACLLEAATTEYRVPILMSEPLVRSCNPRFARHFRPIDHVKLQGSQSATRLFTVDLIPEVLTVESAVREKRRKNLNRAQTRHAREQAKVDILQETYQVHDVFDADKGVKRMRERFFLGFFQEFEKGYLNYEAGEWDVAAQVLRGTRHMLRSGAGGSAEDGPSCTLLEYMRRFGFQAPKSWPGWRELEEK